MTDARLARQSVLVPIVGAPDARLARQSVLVAEVEPGSAITARLARISVLVMVSRDPHGWDIIARDRGTH